MKKIYKSLLLGCVCCCVTATTLILLSCDKYLDVLPDNRAALDTDSKITDLLISAYPETVDCMLAELYCDNTDRNEGSGYTAMTQSPFQEQAATWQEITAITQDTPYALWDHCYKAIGAANNVIIAIDKLGRPDRLKAQLGEALLCRAFCHFRLSNIFCQAYSYKTCDQDLGITYITVPESEVSPVYERGTMAELYRHIEADILEGLPLISDNLHTVVKYHFNRKAACAFAARFYLYYMQEDKSNLDKCIRYASEVIGADPSATLRDWETLGKIPINDAQRGNAFVSADDRANLLILSTKSYWYYVFGATSLGMKYTHNDKIATSESIKARGFWGDYNNYYFDVYTDSDKPKVMMYKLPQFMQIVDVTKNTGNPRMQIPVLTSDACIIDRAEAYALKGDYDKAYGDLTSWLHAFTRQTGTVDAALLEDVYGQSDDIGIDIPSGMTSKGMRYYTPTEPTPKKRLNPDFTVTEGEQENLIHAILHARRVTTIHEGQRWQDVKRYGIEIYRRNIKDGNITVYDTMAKDDPRRAIQLPAQVIKAGITPNPR